jgi:hypothetical protein
LIVTTRCTRDGEPEYRILLIFWDMIPCSLLEVHQQFGGMYCVHHQCQKLNQASKQFPFASISPLSAKSMHIYAIYAQLALLASCFAYFSALEIEVTYSSETSVDFQQPTWHYIRNDITLHSYCCENLKSSILFILSETHPKMHVNLNLRSTLQIRNQPRFTRLSLVGTPAVWSAKCWRSTPIAPSPSTGWKLSLTGSSAALVWGRSLTKYLCHC